MPATNYDPFDIVHTDGAGRPVGFFAGQLRRLFDPIDATCLALFRVLWGLVLAYEGLTHLLHGSAKLQFTYGQTILFPYWGFEWLRVLPMEQMQLLAVLLVMSGLCVAMGLLYLPSLLLWELIFLYFFLLEATIYLNHIYLLLVMNCVLLFCPLNRTLALDSRIGLARPSPNVPRYVVVVLHALLLVVYTYAGVVKINEDWLRAEPLRHWLPKRRRIFPLLNEEFVAYFFSYGGLLFDLVVGPMLLSARTRPLATLLSVFFHCTNKLVFNIGIFPYMMLCSTLLFYHPSWPRMLTYLPPPSPVPELLPYLVDVDTIDASQLPAKQSKITNKQRNTVDKQRNTVDKQRNTVDKQRNTVDKQRNTVDKHLTVTNKQDNDDKQKNADKKKMSAVLQALHPAGWTQLPSRRLKVNRPLTWLQVLLLLLIGAFLLQQAVFPLRNLLYPGDVAWTEYGHLYSWRMKLRDKSCNAEIYVQRGDEQPPQRVVPAHFVSARQWAKIKSRPDLLVVLAHRLGDVFNASVHASVRCQLNWRAEQQFIDPRYDLTQYAPFEHWPYPFVTELAPLTDELLEDYPWNMPADRLWRILTFNSPFVSRDTAQRLDDYSLSKPIPAKHKQ